MSWPKMLPDLTKKDFIYGNFVTSKNSLVYPRGVSSTTPPYKWKDPHLGHVCCCLLGWVRVSFGLAPLPRNRNGDLSPEAREFLIELYKNLGWGLSHLRNDFRLQQECTEIFDGPASNMSRVDPSRAVSAWTKTLNHFGYYVTDDEYVVDTPKKRA